MKHRRVVCFATPLYGVQLIGLLYAEYLSGPVFRDDVVTLLFDVPAVVNFFRSGFNYNRITATYIRVLGERLLYRAVECGVAAACMHGPQFTRNAVVFHYLYPTVQAYRFSRLWLTRAMRAVGGVLYPNCVRRLFFLDDSTDDAERVFLRHPPYPQRDEDCFAEMPPGCRCALQFYYYRFKTHPITAVLESGCVPTVARLLMEQAMWATLFYQEREKRTSPWRLRKLYFADLTMTGMQLLLSNVARAGGVLLGRALSSEPTGGGMFWSQHLTLLATTPLIFNISVRAGQQVRDFLEQRHQRTAEDELEDNREAEEAEEAVRSCMPPPPASGSGSGGGAGGGFGSLLNFSHTVDYYEVLGVEEKAQNAEIKKSYRKLALKNHPDRVMGDAQAQRDARERMAIINEAYDTLINENKRVQYDANRMLANSPNFLKVFDDMSSTTFVLTSVAGLTGLTVLASLAVYAQYASLFQRISSNGANPLMFV